MKNLFGVTLALCVATTSTLGIAQTSKPIPNRGTIQIQGPDIEQNFQNGQGTISKSWTQAIPLTKKEARQQLAILENSLTQKQKDIRRSALDSAIRFINQCPEKGCTAPASGSWPGSKYRVDIELFEGLAFTGTPPQ
jgi:hypothetical protein